MFKTLKQAYFVVSEKSKENEFSENVLNENIIFQNVQFFNMKFNLLL